MKIKNKSLFLIGSEKREAYRTKTLKTYKFAGHENYLIKYKDEWTKDINEFLKTQ